MTEQEFKAILFIELKKIAPECDPAAVDPNQNMRDELDIDSYSFQQLLVELNDRTGIDIPEADYVKVSTLAGMLDYFSTRLA